MLCARSKGRTAHWSHRCARHRRCGEGGSAGSLAATKRIKKLERELARKEKALAEAAALLILKKKLEDYYSAEEDEGTDEDNEK